MSFYLLILSFILSSCAIQMGKIPIIVKKMDSNELNYQDLMERQNNIRKKVEVKKDCLHVFVFIPTKATPELNKVLQRSCPKSNYSFDNKIYDEFFYLLYGRECVVNEYSCENT